jgi:hypothetical protein
MPRHAALEPGKIQTILAKKAVVGSWAKTDTVPMFLHTSWAGRSRTPGVDEGPSAGTLQAGIARGQKRRVPAK